MSDSRRSRRRFLAHAVLMTGGGAMLGAIGARRAEAALAKLPASNAQAKALAYAGDANKVKHALYKPGSTCANCRFFTAGTGACAIFPGYSVAIGGWCAGWAKQP